MPFKYVILNLRKWRRALLCIKKAGNTNKQKNIYLMRLKNVSVNLKPEIQVEEPFVNAKIRCLVIILYAFFRDLVLELQILFVNATTLKLTSGLVQ